MPARILVVDDEPDFVRLMKQRFRHRLKSGDYEFVFAESGVKAWEILQKDWNFDIVLTDINMPGMDGITLLGKISNSESALRTVMVSAYDDMKNIRRSMNNGAYDFVTKPIDFKDLEITIDKTLGEIEVLKQARLAGELKEKNRELTDLNELKSRLFTNISHELRTPLTIITGITEQIEENPNQWLNKGLKMIKRNGNSLLNLVNQILDLRKLEMGKLELHLVHSEIIQYIRYILESFQSLAENKDVRLTFHAEPSELEMDYDPEKLVRILSNLLSNAIKFTPAGGQVGIEADLVEDKEGEFLRILVKDTGIGIAPGKLPDIFQRYYQAEAKDAAEGTGIGLAIVWEFVKLLEGRIEVESKIDQGTTFSLFLPVGQEAEKMAASHGELRSIAPAPLPDRSELTLPDPGMTDQLPQLLIVEDNADVVQYLVACLDGRYQLTFARDGQEGIDKALEQVPDIIISDVMMPRKTGFELCETLKEDDRSSHIPIVLLTARADHDSRMSGLSKGADAYLAKPFNREELLLQLSNLLSLRTKLQAKYRSLDPLESEDSPTREDDFIARVRKVIEDNLDDENFGITELGQAIAMSRAQIHRKIKALTGLSTSIFIRSIRLNKAKALLVNTDLNISQVAYEVGFRDPKYFSRTFSEEFGQVPKDFRK